MRCGIHVTGTIDDVSTNKTDPWQEVGERWSRLGAKLGDRYRDLAGEDGPTETEVREAIRTIGVAVQSVVEGVSSAMKDPAVREQVREATASLVGALGRTFSELGQELKTEDRGGETEEGGRKTKGGKDSPGV